MVHLLVALLSYHQIHSNEDTHLTRALLGEGCWRKDSLLQFCRDVLPPRLLLHLLRGGPYMSLVEIGLLDEQHNLFNLFI